LHRTAQADVVDMESFGSARALARAGVPSLFVRCVVDEAGFDFSLDPARLVDPAGRPRWMAILLEVLRRPSRALVLRSLAVRSRRAAANLAWLCHGVASGLARRESEGTAET
ncbi:MAG: hypothetical protein O7J95_10970, partial [Planctomycetota bacterium]|nr:hypothetical protein [Planctomycetota bacterium]